jgi:hypothetical protein
MNIKQILKELGVPANEIKSRLSNKQIKLNGENFIQSINFDVDISSATELGDFIFDNHQLFNNPLIHLYSGNIQYIFDAPMNWKGKDNNIKQLCELLESHICISLSKQTHYVIKKNNYVHPIEKSERQIFLDNFKNDCCQTAKEDIIFQKLVKPEYEDIFLEVFSNL